MNSNALYFIFLMNIFFLFAIFDTIQELTRLSYQDWQSSSQIQGINKSFKNMESIEMAESLKYSGGTCRLSDKSQSPEKSNKYTCYTCGGNSRKSLNCSTCRGLKTVSADDAMVQLLTEVLSCKLMIESSMKKQLPQIINTTKQFSQIKDEPDKEIVCEICDTLFSKGKKQFMHCHECLQYYVCDECYQGHKFSHEHELEKYCISENISNSSKQIHKKNDEACQSCHTPFENRAIILVCEHCKDNGKKYQICDQCQKEKSHHHLESHIFKPSLFLIEDDYWLGKDGSKFHQSQIFVEEEEQFRQEASQNSQNSSDYASKPRKWLDDPISPKVPKRRSEPSNRFDHFSPTKRCVPKEEVIKQIDSDDQSYEKEKPFKVDSQSSYEDLEGQKFIFEDYLCDICDKHPQNARYHCQICPDYDLCKKCHRQNKSKGLHEHKQFQRIDKEGQAELKKKKQEKRKERNQAMKKNMQKLMMSMSSGRNSL